MNLAKKTSSVIIYILVYLMKYLTLQHISISYSSSILLADFFYNFHKEVIFLQSYVCQT